MFNFLTNLFSKEKDLKIKRKKIGMLSGCVNFVCNIALFISKLIIGLVSGSVAVTVDAFNNLSDCGSSCITLIGFHLSGKPPDKQHPFGHGRMEYITGMIVSILVLMVGFEFAKNSVERILNPQPVVFNFAMLIALVLAMAVKLCMGFINMKFSKAVGGSSAINATVFDSVADVLVTLVALISLITSSYFDFPIDGYLGLIISIFVFAGGLKIMLDAINPLVGQVPDKELVEQIKNKLLSYREIVGVHDMIIHNYGPVNTIVTIHAEVPANNSIIYAHEVIDKAEREVSGELGINLLIHLDPIVTDDKRLNEVKGEVGKTLYKLSPDYSMHDFRMLDGKENINLIFDVLVPYNTDKRDEDIKEEITSALKGCNNKYNPIITIDKSYIGSQFTIS